ncbi:hypothetical protein HU200_043643 [Digitaria exilis]|uniref:Uncharacterized protein n=1 Tax=Digitaria exilis TaxID=1010633 RepID=A0A835B5M8_9POAL|nr:hypothetical protein HU200_043643 [Digitaria exilis]
MEPQEWRPFEISPASYRGFPALLDEMIERAGLKTKAVYQGKVQGSDEEGQAVVTVRVGADPMVPEFKGTIVRAQEEGTANAIQTAAREAVRWVHAEIAERLEDTPYRYLPQALFTQKHLAENVRCYHRDALAEPEEQLRVAARCIHAMDRELLRRDQDVGMLRREKEELLKKVDQLAKEKAELMQNNLQLSKEKKILVDEVMAGSLRQHELEEEMEEQNKTFKIHLDDLTRRKRRALAARNRAFEKLQTYREVTDEEIQELIAELQEMVNLNNQKANAIRQLMSIDIALRITYQARIDKVKEDLEERIQELGRKSTQLRETVGYLDSMDAELIRTEEELEYHRQEARRLRDLEAWVLAEYKDGEQQEVEPAPALKKPRRDDPFLRYFWGPGSEVHLGEYARACAQRAQEEQETDQ